MSSNWWIAASAEVRLKTRLFYAPLLLRASVAFICKPLNPMGGIISLFFSAKKCVYIKALRNIALNILQPVVTPSPNNYQVLFHRFLKLASSYFLPQSEKKYSSSSCLSFSQQVQLQKHISSALDFRTPCQSHFPTLREKTGILFCQ